MIDIIIIIAVLVIITNSLTQKRRWCRSSNIILFIVMTLKIDKRYISWFASIDSKMSGITIESMIQSNENFDDNTTLNNNNDDEEQNSQELV